MYCCFSIYSLLNTATKKKKWILYEKQNNKNNEQRVEEVIYNSFINF